MTFPMLASTGRVLLWCAVVVLWAIPVLAGDASGRVTRILDGDTLEVLHNQHPERIRLNGIDCPEKGQAYGKRAKQTALELVFGKTARTNTGAPLETCSYRMAPT